MKRAAPALVALLLGAAAVARAQAADANPCSGFAFPVDVELGWMSAKAMPGAASGASLPAVPQTALELTLGSSESVVLPATPSGKPHEETAKTYAGFVQLGQIPEAGLYQVSLSSGGWIDVLQSGRVVPSVAHTSKRECPILRKSVQFRLERGAATLLFSSVPERVVVFAIRRP